MREPSSRALLKSGVGHDYSILILPWSMIGAAGVVRFRRPESLTFATFPTPDALPYHISTGDRRAAVSAGEWTFQAQPGQRGGIRINVRFWQEMAGKSKFSPAPLPGCRPGSAEYRRTLANAIRCAGMRKNVRSVGHGLPYLAGNGREIKISPVFPGDGCCSGNSGEWMLHAQPGQRGGMRKNVRSVGHGLPYLAGNGREIEIFSGSAPRAQTGERETPPDFSQRRPVRRNA